MSTAFEATSSGGVALLQDDDPDFEDGPFVAHGVALTEDAVAQGINSESDVQAVYYPPEVVKAAEGMLEGRPLVTDDEHDDFDQPTPSVGTIVGEVVTDEYEEGVGLMFEAEIDDPEIARLVDRGRVEVSPVVAREVGDYSDEHDAHMATRVAGFRDLAVVSEGAGELARIEMGALAAAFESAFGVDYNQALQERQLDPEVEACVMSVKESNPGIDKSRAIAICKAQASEADEPDADVLEALVGEESQQQALAEFKEGDLVRWQTSASPGTGRVNTVVSEAGETVTANGADVTREATEEEPAYKLDNWNGSEYETGTVVKSASELLGAWSDAPDEAQTAEQISDDPDNSEMSKSAMSDQHHALMGDAAAEDILAAAEMPIQEHSEALVGDIAEAVESVDEAAAEELRANMDAVVDLMAEQAMDGLAEVAEADTEGDDTDSDTEAMSEDNPEPDDPEEDDAGTEAMDEQEQEELQTAKRQYASLLADEDFMVDSLVETHSLSELIDRVESSGDAEASEALAEQAMQQNPTAGDVDTDADAGDDGDDDAVGLSALTGEKRQQAEAAKARARNWRGRADDYAEQALEEYNDLTGEDLGLQEV